jgi:NitT/TauT family transport system ATP-binding protein
MSSDIPLVSASDLRKTFKTDADGVDALVDLNVEIRRGEFVSIVGPSGCGKSTFLHMVGGLLDLTAGNLLFDGAPITRPGPDRGVMFQESALYPWRSVAGNIAWPLEVQGVPKAKRSEIVDHFVRLVGLQEFRDRYPNELSGGMRQRVSLARTLSFEPRLLLMDEPFGALDVQTRELMQEELQAIWERTGQTVLLVTHDIDEALFLSDRVLLFSSRPGRVKAQFNVPFERTRRPDIRKSAAFSEIRNEIWDLLREEVVKAHGGGRR